MNLTDNELEIVEARAKMVLLGMPRAPVPPRDRPLSDDEAVRLTLHDAAAMAVEVRRLRAAIDAKETP